MNCYVDATSALQTSKEDLDNFTQSLFGKYSPFDDQGNFKVKNENQIFGLIYLMCSFEKDPELLDRMIRETETKLEILRKMKEFYDGCETV